MIKRGTKLLLDTSKYIKNWLLERTTMVLSLVYFALLLVVMPLVEGKINTASIGHPDLQPAYDSKYVFEFFETIGTTGRHFYPWYSLVELVLAVSICILSSFTISILAGFIVHREDFMDFMDSQIHKTPMSQRNPIRSNLLNIVPLVVLMFECAENIILATTCILFDVFGPRTHVFNIVTLAHVVEVAAKVTSMKWVLIRTSASFTFIILLLVVSLLYRHVGSSLFDNCSRAICTRNTDLIARGKRLTNRRNKT